MPTAADRQSLIDEAWSRVSPTSRTDSPGRFTRARFERIAEILVAVAAAALGGQAVVIAIADGQFGKHALALSVMCTATLVMVLACAVGRYARTAAGAFAVLYVPVVLWWAFSDAQVVDPVDQPWPFYLLSVATAAAMVAFPVPWQLVWAIGVPLLFGGLQLSRSGFAWQVWQMTSADVSVAILLNLLIVALGWMFRGVAAGVDEVRGRVVETYTRARAAEAVESERREIAALMHDSVLAALIASSRAETPRERELAVGMAAEALTRLANAESDEPEGSDAALSAGWVADSVERAAAELGVTLEVARDIPDAARAVPGRAARALVLAAKQAIANAIHHADAAGLAGVVRADGKGVSIEISDTGPGLDLDAIPADRLGIRGSIVARMAAVGGEADIDSGPAGTTVQVSWREADERRVEERER